MALKVFRQRLKKSLYPRLARMSFDKDCDENVFIALHDLEKTNGFAKKN